MIKTIIFDLGNVVLGFDPKTYLKEKIKDNEKVEKVFKAIFRSKEWVMLDEGAITEEEAIEVICKNNMDLEAEVRVAFDNWYPILKPIESTVEIIKELKEKGYRLLYLSNFHDKAFKYVNANHDFFKLFDGGVVSYEDKLIKPDKRIYKLILERYDLDPSECIFIDDMKENVEAAEDCGINGINLKNPNELKELLKEYIK